MKHVLMASLCLLSAIPAFWLVGYYVYAVIWSLGQSDRSFIYWGLPFLFMGSLLFSISIASGVTWYFLSRERRSHDSVKS